MNFYLRAYTDAGALLSTPLTITRSTGDVGFIGNLSLSGANPSIYMNGSAIDQTALISNANGSNSILKFKSSSFIWSNSDDVERARIKTDGSIRITGGGATTSATLELSSSATPSGGGSISVSYLGTGSYGPLTLATGGATRLTIDATGNIGIATSLPNIGGYGSNSRVLTIQGVSGSYGILELTSNSANADGNAIGRLDFGSDGQTAGYKAISSIASFLSGSTSTKFGADLRFYTRVNNAGSGDPVERMRILSNGVVHIGSTTDYVQIANDSIGTWIENSNATSSKRRIRLQSLNAAATKYTTLRVDGTNSQITFETEDLERMRIGSNGGVVIGDTLTTAAKLYVVGYGTANSLMTQPVLTASSGSNAVQLGSDGTHALIGAGNSGTSLILLSRASGEYTQAIVIASNNTVKINNLGTGTVYSNGGVLTNTNPSDKNLKENITDLSFGLNEILKLRPVSFDWKNNPKNQSTQYGFIAQEVQKILPQLVNEFDSFEDEDTEISTKRLGLDKDAIFVSLVKAIQEQQAQIEELKLLINK